MLPAYVSGSLGAAPQLNARVQLLQQSC
jgi:hypothetical protein